MRWIGDGLGFKAYLAFLAFAFRVTARGKGAHPHSASRGDQSMPREVWIQRARRLDLAQPRPMYSRSGAGETCFTCLISKYVERECLGRLAKR